MVIGMVEQQQHSVLEGWLVEELRRNKRDVTKETCETCFRLVALLLKLISTKTKKVDEDRSPAQSCEPRDQL